MKEAVLIILTTLHLAATVTWIGGMAFNLMVVMPAGRKCLDADNSGVLSAAVLARFAPFVYVSIGVLAVTGYWMAYLDPAPTGAPEATLWRHVLIGKHILSALMATIAVSILLHLFPKIRRMAGSEGEPGADVARLRRLQGWLVRLNLFLGLIVLFVSAALSRL